MEYSYQGFSVQKLEELCGREHRLAAPCPPVYPLCEQYSQGRIYREYARFPYELPLYIYSDHGIHLSTELRPDEREQKAFAMFSYSRSRFPLLQKSLSMPCYRVPHPLIWYRHEHGIAQSSTAKGTICFPAHSVLGKTAIYDIAAFCRQLMELPADMQPVNVCLFMTDIHHGTHLKYLEQGMPVVTAGSVWDFRFADRYYDILKQYKYAISNCIGAYTYYSAEMGIPFSFLPTDCEYRSPDNKELPNERAEKKEVEKLFLGLHKEITKQQRNYIAYAFDTKECISREEMHEILVKAYAKYKIDVAEGRI